MSLDHISRLVDRDTFEPESDDLVSRDPLSFPDYSETLDKARAKSSSDESVLAGRAQIGGIDVEVAAFDFGFLGGSMGEVAGERLARSMERAAARRVPFVLRTSTGGARMQEGMRSLVQMPKLVAQRIELASAHQPFVVVLGDPTTGGVLASIAALADATVAETGATIGFAGPRVAERFTGEPVPDGSHTATSAYAAGLVDEIVAPDDAHSFVASVLKITMADDPQEVDAPPSGKTGGGDAWDVVQSVRGMEHPVAPDLMRDAADHHIELRGDRNGTDDPGLIALLARVAGRRIVGLALDRRHHPGPGAYRKARRCIDIAARLDIPVVTLVDTRGADPSADSEAGGIAWEIAQLFEVMLNAPVPVLSLITGEGGSGGALAFATADHIAAFGNSFFSVIAPEGAAEILWRDGDRAADAARALKLDAQTLLELGIADEVMPGTPTPEAIKYAVATRLSSTEVSQDVAAARRNRWRTR